jgi:NAD(P)-dependent dehydrogenase (short-subunit alcohol dehydrogenase family)
MAKAVAKQLVIVTGAGRGIGQATAAAFGGRGDHVVLAARTEAELATTADLVRAAGGTATVVPGDLTSEPAVEQLLATAATITGKIDVVVCNAGVAAVAPFTELSLDDWERTLRTTLTGTFLVCKHAVAHMQPGGQIFTLGSIAGRSGFPNWSAYSAAKFGVLGFSEAIRAELRPRGIRVTAIIPGAVDTPLWDQVPGQWDRAKMLQPADVARSIVRAADEPAYVSIDEIVLGHVAGAL